MKRIFLLVALLVSAHSSWALTLSEAAENLLYFEYAKQSSAHCERRGTPSQQTLAAWEKKNHGLYRRSIETIRSEAKRRGASPAEQDMIVSESIKIQQTHAQENIAQKGVPCAKFGAWLDGFSTLLKL